MKTNNVKRDALIACFCVSGVLTSADVSGEQKSLTEMSPAAETSAGTPVRFASMNPFTADQFATPPLPMIGDTPSSLRSRIEKIGKLHNDLVRRIPDLISHDSGKNSEPEEGIEHINALDLRGISILDEKIPEANAAHKKGNRPRIQRRKKKKKNVQRISPSGGSTARNLRERPTRTEPRQQIDYAKLNDDDKFLLNL